MFVSRITFALNRKYVVIYFRRVLSFVQLTLSFWSLIALFDKYFVQRRKEPVKGGNMRYLRHYMCAENINNYSLRWVR